MQVQLFSCLDFCLNFSMGTIFQITATKIGQLRIKIRLISSIYILIFSVRNLEFLEEKVGKKCREFEFTTEAN